MENYENLSFGFGVFNIFGKILVDVIWWYIFLKFLNYWMKCKIMNILEIKMSKINMIYVSYCKLY